MKVLWFEVTEPAAYKGDGLVIGGWQDSLEHIVRQCEDIELYIAFESFETDEVKVINGVTYIPMKCEYSILERIKKRYSWAPQSQKLVEKGVAVVNKYNPDIIHVFGNEWPFGLIAPYVKQPVVIHIQGAIVPYFNAKYPPSYNLFTELRYAGFNPKKWLGIMLGDYNWKSRLEMEKKTWKCVHNYMGRTCWDKALVDTLCTDARYFHVEEALRPSFLTCPKIWEYRKDGKIRLISTGCSSFLKGIDVILKTAHVLKEAGVNFEWIVAGRLNDGLRTLVERKEGLKFEDNNIRILGFVKPDQLRDLLCESTMYVHTAYIENSPNSICEAQLLGVPIVSTMVGGISTLVKHEEEGVLVPTNDPWLMAGTIMNLANDEMRLKMYSANGRKHALKRHDPQNILKQLLDCYHFICNKKL